MNKRLQIEHLTRMLHLEVHLVSGYDSALERLSETAHHSQLESFRSDHERHVLDLTELMREMGEPTPAGTPEVESLFAPGMAAMRNSRNDTDVMQAVRLNEQVVGRQYLEARDWGVGVQVHELLERHDEDERRHLAWFEKTLSVAPGVRGTRG